MGLSMDLYASLERLKFDTRMIQRNRQTTNVKSDELEQFLKSLPDLASVCEPLTLESGDSFSSTLNGEDH